MVNDSEMDLVWLCCCVVEYCFEEVKLMDVNEMKVVEEKVKEIAHLHSHRQIQDEGKGPPRRGSNKQTSNHDDGGWKWKLRRRSP